MMPIRPENRGCYPKDWKAISARIRFTRAAADEFRALLAAKGGVA